MSVPSRVGGVYCLSKDSKSVSYVGRAEQNLRDEIKSHWPEYQFFWYESSLSSREAFFSHCRSYHRHADDGLESREHPAAPPGLDARCPVCGK